MAGVNPADTFRLEAQELLEQLEHTLLDLEENPELHDLIDTAFRALHTIKGSGSMFGFERVAAFTHHVETAFDEVRKGKAQCSRELISVALAAQDVMRRLIEAPERDCGDEDKVLERLRTVIVIDHAGQTETAGGHSKVEPAVPESATYRIRFRLPPAALANGTNPLLLLDELRLLGSCTVAALEEDIPTLDAFDPQECYLAWDVVLTTDKPRTAIDDVFIFVIDDMELKVNRLDAGDTERRLGQILVERGDAKPEAVTRALAGQETLGQLLVKSGEVSEDKVASALAEQRHLRQEVDQGRTVTKDAATIRVAADRLDGLMDRVGELVIAQARLRQLAVSLDDIALKAVAEEIERLASDLRETTMGIRMVPIGSLFGRYRRLVHDLARDLGKNIRLVTSGEETELDKTVIDRLADPLVHLIRNSLDHGIETPEKRLAANKNAEGTLHLSARHVGAEVLITIRDDGKGLDTLRIRARAEEAGLIAAGAKVDDNELFQCIFAPGFSTAAEVTSVSGRGVGMDVVKRTIDGLRGIIEISSRPGQGAEVTLHLPLTLAIIDGLLVRIGQGRYVIPLSAVEECVELSAADDARSRGRNFLNIRGDLVPFLRLREMFNSRVAADPYQKVVVVSAGDQRVGLVVDQVIGDHQTVIKSLSRLHADVEIFSGGTILGDGTVALILDVAQMVERGRRLSDQQRQAS